MIVLLFSGNPVVVVGRALNDTGDIYRRYGDSWDGGSIPRERYRYKIVETPVEWSPSKKSENSSFVEEQSEAETLKQFKLLKVR